MPIVRLAAVDNTATLVALPGLGRNSYSFMPSMFTPVRELGITVFCMDYGTHVDSIQDMAAYVWSCLDNLVASHSPLVLLGYSMGGFVAQAMYSQRPSSVSGVVFLSTTCPTVEDVLAPFMSKSALATTMQLWFSDQDKEQRARRAAVLAKHKAGLLEVPLSEYMHVLDHSRIPKEEYGKEMAACFAYALSNVSVGIVARMTCPVLVIYGSRDEVIPVKSMRRLRDALPLAKTYTEIEIPGGGHSVMYQSTKVISDNLTQWLKRVLKSIL